MADFNLAFEKTLMNEGGFVLHTVPGDSGGKTFAGIAYNYHPNWAGWNLIDRGDVQNETVTQLVREFYQVNFWNPMKGDEISHQLIAENIYDFGVNAGVKTSVKLAQAVVGAVPDGVIGSKTLAKLNATSEELFVTQFALAKIARYAAIVNRNRTQSKFLLGWINRTLKSIN